MKPYFTGVALPTTNDLATWNALVQQLIQGISPFKMTLSTEDRKGKRKMGTRRIAYAQSAETFGNQYIDVMPRQFNPADFSAIMAYQSSLRNLVSRLTQLQEMCDDTLMAAGIDAMTYTKTVHDAIRSANNLDPSYDGALSELDEYNSRAQAEDDSTTKPPPPAAV